LEYWELCWDSEARNAMGLMWEKKVFSIVTTHAVGPGEE